MKPIIAMATLCCSVFAFGQSPPADRVEIVSEHRGCTATNPGGASSAENLSPGLINGALTPDLVPELTAYRLFFVVAAGALNSSSQEGRKRALIVKLQMEEDDAAKVFQSIRRFADADADLLRRYNDSADELISRGATPDYNSFLGDRDQLVSSIREELRNTLSQTGYARLNEIVRAERAFMKVAPRPLR